MSEIVGVVLLFGLVMAGAAMVVVLGATATDQVSDRQRLDAAVTSVQQFDSEVGSLTADGNTKPAAASKRVSLAPGGATASVVRGGGAERADRLTIAVHGQGSSPCTATVRLDALEQRLSDGRQVVYQAGGVWRGTAKGRMTLVSAPGVEYAGEGGRINVEIPRLSEYRGDGEVTVRNSPGTAADRTENIREQLFGDSACYRPDKITLTVRTAYPHAWHEYLRQEFPPGSVVNFAPDAGPETGTVTVALTDLPARTNPEENAMLDFTTDDATTGKVTGDGILVDKPDTPAASSYNVSVRTLGTYSGYEDRYMKEVTKTVPVYKKVRVPIYKKVPITVGDEPAPLNAVMLMDESGSMGGGSPHNWKMKAARSSTKEFIDAVKDNGKNRVGVYSFESHAPDDASQDLTTNFGKARSVAGNPNAGGGTDITEALAKAVNHLQSDSPNASRQTIVLMTDGKGSRNPLGDAETGGPVGEARNNTIRVHTIAIGDKSNVNSTLLKSIAFRTRGEYHHVTNREELEDALRGIGKNTTKYEWVFSHWETKKVYVGETTKTVKEPREMVVKKPVTVEVTVGGSTESLVGEAGADFVDRAINYVGTGKQPPSVSSGFELEDGQSLTVDSWRGSCDTSGRIGYGASDLQKVEDGSGNVVTVSPPGSSDDWPITECTTTNGTATPNDVAVYHDGEAVPSSLAGADGPRFWQRDVGGLASRYVDGGQFDLDSNQVVVVVRYDNDGNGATDHHNLVLLLEAGDARSEVTNEWLVNVDVDDVELEDG